MGKVSGNWITGAHSGRACNHDDIYTKVNKKTGACYSVKLCNPNTDSNETQLKTQSAFGLVSKAMSDWINTEKAANSADYKKVKKSYDAQNKYATMRGYMMAKGMYTVSADKQTVTVDISARTDFKTAFCINAAGESGANGSSGSSGGSQNQNTTTYTLNISSANGEQGTVNTSMNKTYNSGATVSIQATAKEGYKFDQWNDGNKNASRTLTMTQNYNLVASFKVDDGSEEEPEQEIS